MTEFNLALVLVGGLVLLLGLTSGLVNNRLLVSESLLALLVGVLLGPAFWGLLDLTRWGEEAVVLEEAARLTLAITLMGTALRLPERYIRQHAGALAVLLGLVMPLMWLSSALLVFLLLGVPIWVALLVGAVVTPTDPVVASAIVTGKIAEGNLPERVRHAISAEAGANDGLALPFVLLPILFLTRPPGEALRQWLLSTLLWEVLGAVLIGATLGYLAGRLLKWSQAKLEAEATSLLALALALSITALGLVKLLGSDGVLATFAAGLTFDTVVRGPLSSSHERLQGVIRRFFDLPVFVLVGATLPWGAWLELGWRGLLLAAAVLLLRRLPALLLLSPLIAPLESRRDALFVGWFGPIGVAALFYATFALRETGLEVVWEVGSLLIFASVLVHGASATPLTRWYGRGGQPR